MKFLITTRVGLQENPPYGPHQYNINVYITEQKYGTGRVGVDIPEGVFRESTENESDVPIIIENLVMDAKARGVAYARFTANQERVNRVYHSVTDFEVVSENLV